MIVVHEPASQRRADETHTTSDENGFAFYHGRSEPAGYW